MKPILLALLAFTLHAQGNATWSGGGGDNNWSTPKNWSWDNNACQGLVAPGMDRTVDSVCTPANATIPAGFTVVVDAPFVSQINNFSLGAKATLQGYVSAFGNVTVSAGAQAMGGVSAGQSSGTLTNAGQITLTGGAAAGVTIVNSGTISGFGSVNALNGGTNTGTIEATGQGTFNNISGGMGLNGNWENAKGTIQIDKGAVLIADATISDGAITNSGVIAGQPLTLAGSIKSNGITFDAPSPLETSNINITGTLTNSNLLVVGYSGGVTTLNVKSGGDFTSDLTTIGSQANATGQLLITGTNPLPISTGILNIASLGKGLLSLSGGTTLNASIVQIGAGGVLLIAASAMNYTTLTAPAASQVNPFGYGSSIQINQAGNLTGAPEEEAATSQSDEIAVNVLITGTRSAWTARSGLAITGGTTTISGGGALNVQCNSCSFQSLRALSVSAAGSVMVTGSGSTLASATAVIGGPSLDASAGPSGKLTVQGGGQVNNISGLSTGKFDIRAGATVLADGPGTELNTNVSLEAGSLTVQNQAKVNTLPFALSVSGGALVVQDSGQVITEEASVSKGSVVLQRKGNLDFAALPFLSIGPAFGTNSGTVTVSDTGALTPEEITIYRGGLLKITNDATVFIPTNANVSLPGGTIDVNTGALVMGPTSHGEGWVTVGPGATLSGGVVDPTTNGFYNGPGTIVGSVFVDLGGKVSIGDPEVITVTQNYQQVGGTLDFEIDGTQPGQYDQLAVGGSSSITGGTIEFDFANGFAPSAGDVYHLITAAAGNTVTGVNYALNGLASGFNYQTNVTAGGLDLDAMSSGVSTAPPPTPPATNLTVVDAAGSSPNLAAGSLASAYGSGLATGQPLSAALPWPATLGGTTVSILDLSGTTTMAPVIYVSATLVNFWIPDTVALGPALITITAGDGTVSTGAVTLADLAPALFTVNTSGLAAAYVDCISSAGTSSLVAPFQAVNGAVVPQPLNLGACPTAVLELYGTGIDTATQSAVQVTMKGAPQTVLYAGPQFTFPGLDQINVLLPQSLAGAGNVPIVLSTANGASKTVNITIQ